MNKRKTLDELSPSNEVARSFLSGEIPESTSVEMTKSDVISEALASIPEKDKTIRIGITLKGSLHKRLKKLSKDKGIPVSQILAMGGELFCDTYEGKRK